MKNKIHWISKLALTLSVVCIVVSVLNLIFWHSDFLRDTIWALIFVVMACNYFWLFLTHNDLFKKSLVKDYEINELKYSYMQMGKFVNEFEFMELPDIELRIANELRDIEIKKKDYAEMLGIKEK